MVPRELATPKPKLKAQVGWRHDDADVELADVKGVALAEACPALVLAHEFLLLDAGQVAFDVAELACAS